MQPTAKYLLEGERVADGAEESIDKVSDETDPDVSKDNLTENINVDLVDNAIKVQEISEIKDDQVKEEIIKDDFEVKEVIIKDGDKTKEELLEDNNKVDITEHHEQSKDETMVIKEDKVEGESLSIVSRILHEKNIPDTSIASDHEKSVSTRNGMMAKRFFLGAKLLYNQILSFPHHLMTDSSILFEH